MRRAPLASQGSSVAAERMRARGIAGGSRLTRRLQWPTIFDLRGRAHRRLARTATASRMTSRAPTARTIFGSTTRSVGPPIINKCFDIVAADQHQAAASVDGRRIDHREARLTSTCGIAEAVCSRNGAPARRSARSAPAPPERRRRSARLAAFPSRTSSRTSKRSVLRAVARAGNRPNG